MTRDWRRYGIVAGLALALAATAWFLIDTALLIAAHRSGAGPAPALSTPVDPAATLGPREAVMPFTAGDWTWQRGQGGSSVARFGGGLVSVTCNPGQRRVTLTRRGAAGVGAAPAITILTSRAARTFAGQREGEGIAVTLAGDDPLLDALALSKGRFGIAVEGLDPLYPGSWPEVARVIEDCRAAPAPAR